MTVTGVRIFSMAACLTAVALSACSTETPRDHPPPPDSARAARPAVVNGTMPETWSPPAVDSAPKDPVAIAVYRGLAILTHTRDSLPRYVGNSNLNCTSCHLNEGRRANAAPLAGVFARYPRFIDRAAAVIPIEDRVNYCFTRSLAGSRLPNDSREMQDIVAYLAYISRDVPVGTHVVGEGMAKMPALVGDSVKGHTLFLDSCARCHGADGAGISPAPALWGPKSFSVGASMARQERAASFIRHNMPFDKPGTVSDQQAYDIAAFIVGQSRPDLPGKELDWPNGGAPSDVPYDTKGHTAVRPPRLIPRLGDPRTAIVDAPTPVARAK